MAFFPPFRRALVVTSLCGATSGLAYYKLSNNWYTSHIDVELPAPPCPSPTTNSCRIEQPSALPFSPFQMQIRAVSAPPPIGCMLWPAGRVLLQWALEELPHGAVVLEVGSGCGCTAIGLAKGGGARRVIATDSCPAALDNLRSNVQANAAQDRVQVAHWDINREGPPPCSLEEVSHILAADLVYEGGGVRVVRQLTHMLTQHPHLQAHLLLVDRFSGGVVAGLASQAGLPQHLQTQVDVDPQIAAFEKALLGAGLEVSCRPVPRHVADAVERAQPLWTNLKWSAQNVYGGLRLYEVRAVQRGVGEDAGSGPAGAGADVAHFPALHPHKLRRWRVPELFREDSRYGRGCHCDRCHLLELRDAYHCAECGFDLCGACVAHLRAEP